LKGGAELLTRREAALRVTLKRAQDNGVKVWREWGIERGGWRYPLARGS
jgi:hypothetical protein